MGVIKTYTIDGEEYSQKDINDLKIGRRKSRRNQEIIAKFEELAKNDDTEDQYITDFKKKYGVDKIESVWIDDDGKKIHGKPITNSLERVNFITVKDFVKVFYRGFWNYANSGKNALDPKDELQEVVSRIVYASYLIGLKRNVPVKTVQLIGETIKFHPHGNTSIEDSIKGLATAYKSPKATRLLEGIGNFGFAPGDPGAAGRYTSVSSTPLLDAIFKDMPFVDVYDQGDGVKEPEFIPTPIPIGLINGVAQIGVGRSNYIAERDAREVIDWIDYLRDHNWKSATRGKGKVPFPVSVNKCNISYNDENGYIYYDAVIHYNVDRDDITKKGNYDVITNLPPSPKSTTDFVIQKLKDYAPKRWKDLIVDGSGKGRPIWIGVPHGIIKRRGADWFKLGLRYARKEYILMWDDEKVVDGIKGTMVETNLETVAQKWFENRKRVVSKRLLHEISELQIRNHRLNLIKIYVDNKMNHWKSEDIQKFYINLAKENSFLTDGQAEAIKNNDIEAITPEEQGKKDANIVLSTAARAFLPENIGANDLEYQKNEKEINRLHKIMKNIGDEIIKEAKDIIDQQEKFFDHDEVLDADKTK